MEMTLTTYSIHFLMISVEKHSPSYIAIYDIYSQQFVCMTLRLLIQCHLEGYW